MAMILIDANQNSASPKKETAMTLRTRMTIHRQRLRKPGWEEIEAYQQG